MAVPSIAALKRKRKKKPSLLLTLSAAVLLIVGGIIAFWLFTLGRPLERDLPLGVNIIPQDAVFAVSLTTDTKQWEKLRGFGTPETQKELEQNLIKLRDRFLTNYGYDFQKDIKPWVGDAVTVAVLAPPIAKDPSQAVANGNVDTPQSLVLVLPVKNPNLANNILTQPKPLKQGKWSDRNYQGIPIKQTEGLEAENLSVALLDGKFLVITDHPQATERAIDAYKNKLNLATSVGFADNFPKIANYQPLAQFYLNVPIAARIASTAPDRRLPAQVLTQLQNNQGLAGTITLESEGMRVKGISWLNPNSQRVLAVENKAGTMQNRFPGETLMMLSGSNLQRLWGEYISTSENNPLSPFTPQQLRQGVKTLTNLDLERDLLNWMTGEFAISIIPNTPKPGTAESFRAGLVLMLQASDRTAGENALKQLDEAMRSQFQFQTQPATVANQPVINWIAPYGTLTATHGWLDGDIAFFVLGAPVTDKIIPKPNQTLANTPPFQQTISTELNPPNSQFFLDVEKTAQNFTLGSIFPNQQTFLAATRTIGMTTAIKDNRSTRYDVFVNLKKSK
ncbi:MAG TPA: DUF3352 domain-containing protein [Nostocaceae cyanobacterium]|nr:DUF3352 domain-containing protein [Nostocaceae cyanobacterium]